MTAVTKASRQIPTQAYELYSTSRQSLFYNISFCVTDLSTLGIELNKVDISTESLNNQRWQSPFSIGMFSKDAFSLITHASQMFKVIQPLDNLNKAQ